MSIFFGTLLIILLCCLAMGVGLLMGKPLQSRCGMVGTEPCRDCPRRRHASPCPERAESAENGDEKC